MDQLVGVTVPLGEDGGGFEVDEAGVAFASKSLGEESFSGAWRAVEQDTSLLPQKRCFEVFWSAHWGDDVSTEIVDDVVETTDVREVDVDLEGVDYFLCDDLQGGGIDVECNEGSKWLM